MNRVIVTLDQPEYSALLKAATQELRNPPDQLRQILREELQERGLLRTEQTSAKVNRQEARR